MNGRVETPNDEVTGSPDTAYLARLVSICIPSYQRPTLLRAALESCAAQSYRDIEILVGDDSADDRSSKVVEQFALQYGGAVHYERNAPSLGQAGNVNRLFSRARGGRIVLLHDDDLLEPDAVAVLANLWDRYPGLSAAFGKQWVIDEEGVVLPITSFRTNTFYQRTARDAGLLDLPAKAGLLRMFPNDAYMIDATLARSIGYRATPEVGDACDFDFGVRACLAAGSVYYVDKALARYRITRQSISARSNSPLRSYEIMHRLALPQCLQSTRRRALKQLAPAAASALARAGKPGAAWSVLWSLDYSWRMRLSLRGLYHMLLTLRAALVS